MPVSLCQRVKLQGSNPSLRKKKLLYGTLLLQYFCMMKLEILTLNWQYSHFNIYSMTYTFESFEVLKKNPLTVIILGMCL